jgi:hypothetical protein
MKTVPSSITLFILPGLQKVKTISSCFKLNALRSSSSSLIEPIAQHPAVSALLSVDSRPRSKLRAKHKYLFQNRNITDDSSSLLFDELALVACSTGVVPRKELFETYAAAIYIHEKFPHMKRMADLAAGHGLLSWFLLALDYNDNGDGSGNGNIIAYNNSTKSTTPRPRTVVCIDRRMPPSADVIATAMIERFPELESRWSYIQSDLAAIVPHPSCLLTSVHACGTLSDYLIEMAIGDPGDGKNNKNTGAPLAIVPCCHTVKARKGYRPHFLSGMQVEEVAALVEERQNKQENMKCEAVADVIDEVRCRTLINAGYEVEEIMLPAIFTARNRLLLAKEGTSVDKQVQLSHPESYEIFKKEHPISPRIQIPLADDKESIAHCHAISGRDLAKARLFEQIPKHFSLSLVMSIWLTETRSTDQSILTLETLHNLAKECCGEIETEDMICTVEAYGEVNVQSETGRRSQRYRFTYKKPEGTDISNASVSRSIAKRIDSVIRERVVHQFGDILR